MTYSAARRVLRGAILTASTTDRRTKRMKVLRKKVYPRWVIFFGLEEGGGPVFAYHDQVNR